MIGKERCNKCRNWFEPNTHACKYTKQKFNEDVKYLADTSKIHEPYVRRWLGRVIRLSGGKIE